VIEEAPDDFLRGLDGHARTLTLALDRRSRAPARLELVSGATDRNVFDRMRLLRRALGPIEAVQVRRFGRSVLSTVFRTPVLLLHTTGRMTGVERTTTLAYDRDEDGSLLIVGGSGGQVRIPDWVANLREHPRAAVTVNRERFEITAIELGGAERATVWQRLRAVWPQIETYERRAGRPVPVFRLTRTREHDDA
jgi:deazaflavin-dependent oxidoreductase (nitroreductase family)